MISRVCEMLNPDFEPHRLLFRPSSSRQSFTEHVSSMRQTHFPKVKIVVAKPNKFQPTFPKQLQLHISRFGTSDPKGRLSVDGSSKQRLPGPQWKGQRGARLRCRSWRFLKKEQAATFTLRFTLEFNHLPKRTRGIFTCPFQHCFRRGSRI